MLFVRRGDAGGPLRVKVDKQARAPHDVGIAGRVLGVLDNMVDCAGQQVRVHGVERDVYPFALAAESGSGLSERLEIVEVPAKSAPASLRDSKLGDLSRVHKDV